MNKTIKYIIIALSIIVFMSAIATGVVYVFRQKQNTKDVENVPNNVIQTNDEENNIEKESDNNGVDKKNEDKNSNSNSITSANLEDERNGAINEISESKNESTNNKSATQGQGVAQQNQGTIQKSELTTSREPVEITLYNKNSEYNTPLLANNMFPGDSVTNNYAIDVYYTNMVTIKFMINIDKGDMILADNLKYKIALNGTSVVYEGIVSEMKEPISRKITAANIGKQNEKLDYKITIYLDDGTKADCQNKQLSISFKWWAEETKNLVAAPQTGDNYQIKALCLTALCASLMIAALLVTKRKRGAK